MIQSVGYLMRTTAVYGNGKFGIADRACLLDRPEMVDPFRPEMLTVWLIRGFTHDLVEHVAERRDPTRFVPLDLRLKRYLGIGNATGLGMAPFLVNHPILINNWMQVRETALARVRAVETAGAPERDRVRQLLTRATDHVDAWHVEDERQMRRIETLRSELHEIGDLLETGLLEQPLPWNALVDASAVWSLEAQELLVALLIEIYPALVDGLSCCMASVIPERLDPAMSVAELSALIDRDWAWALAYDFDHPVQTAQFWYVSEEKLEPRLGRRHEEPGAELEQPLDIARQVQALRAAIDALAEHKDPMVGAIADFLAERPQHRLAVRRVQVLARHPFAEIQENLIGEDCLPIDMLRAKLSFFGASRFDPKSDRWTRITLYLGAPVAETIGDADADDWWLPVLTDQVTH